MSHSPDSPISGGFSPGSRDHRSEQRLHSRIERHQREARRAVRALVDLYADHGQTMHAREMARVLIEAFPDGALRAAEAVQMGLHFEHAHHYELAAWTYELGLTYRPAPPELRYWLHNNLGFSLNQFGAYVLAERHCRAAIRIDAQRYNGHKNLAVALEGQGCPAEAAESYVASVRAEPHDLRAVRHLASLIERHGDEVAVRVPQAITVLEEFAHVIGVLGPLPGIAVPEDHSPPPTTPRHRGTPHSEGGRS